MSKRTWHKGPPPHRGWWVASVSRLPEYWRWWNGEFWSVACKASMPVEKISQNAATLTFFEMQEIEWSYYWPANARVPRVDPRGKK